MKNEEKKLYRNKFPNPNLKIITKIIIMLVGMISKYLNHLKMEKHIQFLQIKQKKIDIISILNHKLVISLKGHHNLVYFVKYFLKKK